MARLAFSLSFPAIALLSLIPSADLPQSGFLSWDKAQHFLAYAGITGLAVLSFSRRTAMRCGVAIGAFSLCIEVLQPFFDRRFGFGDLFANCLGIAVVLASQAVLAALNARTRKPPSPPADPS